MEIEPSLKRQFQVLTCNGATPTREAGHVACTGHPSTTRSMYANNFQIVALPGSKFTTCWKKFHHKWQHDEIHPKCMNLRALSFLSFLSFFLLLLLLLFELSSSVALEVETLAKPNHLMFHNVDRQSTLRPQRAEAPWLQRVAGIFQQIDGTGMGRSYLYSTWEIP